jgi:hypothetical protein
VLRLLVSGGVVPSLPILVTMMIKALHSSETSTLEEPHGVTSQKTAFFIVTAVKLPVMYSNYNFPYCIQMEVANYSSAPMRHNLAI